MYFILVVVFLWQKDVSLQREGNKAFLPKQLW